MGEKTIRQRMNEFFDGCGHNQFTTKELVDRFDCSKTCAQRYRRKWDENRRRRDKIAFDRVVDTYTCDGCSWRPWCEHAVTLGLPIYCENVTKDDLAFAERIGEKRQLLARYMSNS